MDNTIHTTYNITSSNQTSNNKLSCPTEIPGEQAPGGRGEIPGEAARGHL